MEFDPEKDKANIATHRISLQRSLEMDFENGRIITDDRFPDYNEKRFVLFDRIEGKPYELSFTVRADRIRPISLHHVSRDRGAKKYGLPER